MNNTHKPLITIRLDGELTGFGVYVYYKKDEAIYVGFGRQVIARVFAQHSFSLINSSDRVEIFPAKSLQHGLALERYLTVLLKPKFADAKVWGRYSIEDARRMLESLGENDADQQDVNPKSPEEKFYRQMSGFQA